MSEYDELVNQLQRESRHHTDVKAEAAQAIERLEAERDRYKKAHEIEVRLFRHELAEARAEIEQYKRLYNNAKTAYQAVVGWRERDWPEEFDRRTAEMIADLAAEALAAPAPKSPEEQLASVFSKPMTLEEAYAAPTPERESERRKSLATLIIAEQTGGKNDPEEWLIPINHEDMKDRGLAIADAIIAAQQQAKESEGE